MKKTVFLILLSCLCISYAFADLPFRNQRRDMFRMLPINENSIVFTGNSITQGNEWSESFSNDPRVVNRGISGNTSAEIMNNMDYILKGKPAKLFIMIGINDGANPDIVVPCIRKSIELAQKESPDTEVYIQSILPYAGNANVKVTNELLQELCKEKEVTYIDVFSKLNSPDNELNINSNHSNDRLHLMGSGYYVWTEEFEKYTGIKPSIVNTSNATIPSSHTGYVNQRVSNFASKSVSENDILMLGDFHTNTGEWKELLQNPNVKSRGIGVNHGGSSISLVELKDMIPHIITGNPAKVFISCGYKDIEYNNKSVSEAITTYKAILALIKEKAPDTKIYIQSLAPRNNATTNTNLYVPFNTELAKLTDESNNIYFIDVYTPLVKNGVLDSQYAWSDRGFNGKGYLKWAEILAPYVDENIVPLRVDAYDLIMAVANARQFLYELKEEGAGAYTTEATNVFRTAIEAADAVANNKDATAEDYQTAANTLTTATNTFRNSEISLPLASTEVEEHWYKLSAPLRNAGIYMKGEGANNGVVFTSSNNYESQQWKLTKRSDNSFNIINRMDNSFLNPVATHNTQMNTTATEPASGWTFTKSDGSSKFIIKSGSTQLNLTNSGVLFNWGGGSNTSDTGCQFLFTEVTGSPEKDPADPNIILTIKDVSCNGKEFFRVPDEFLQRIVGKKDMTIAIDFTTSTASSSFASLIAVADTTNTGRHFSASVWDSNYSVLYQDQDVSEHRFSNSLGTATTRHQIVYVFRAENPKSIDYYLDGAFKNTYNYDNNADWVYETFGTITDANALTIGGFKSSTKDINQAFKGTVHSVQFFDGAMANFQIGKLISYDNLIADVIGEEPEKPELPASLLTLANIECDGPVLVPSTQAAPVLAEESLTVAIDFTPSSTTGDAILVGSSDIAADNKFFGVGTISNFSKFGIRFVGNNELEGWYTGGYSNATKRHQIVITMSPSTPNYNYYVDGVFNREVSGMGAYGYYYFGKEAIKDAQLYIGGIVSANDNNRYPFTGTIHSVQFFPGVLTAEQVSAIDYKVVIDDIISIDEKSDDMPFTIVDGSIITKDNASVKLFDLSGRMLPTNNIKEGCYILVVDGKSFKVIL
ncbi:lysophospholipase L1-like esterase [Dysgonomonadaceae bacterium PH5-43]|nr:lysophospholipase L1-like esterase [Dysgonomonadaceae bacterium PH5-43]